MASIAIQLAQPAPSPNFGMMTTSSAYYNNNFNNAMPSHAPATTSQEGINLQQVGEEVEGIVMLSLLKQKLEAFSEIINKQRKSSFDERDNNSDADEYGRGKRRPILNSNYNSSGASSPKRRRIVPRDDEPADISSRNSWIENFAVVKRLSQLHDNERRQIETIQMNEWIEQQQNLYNRRLLSEERIELLRMIGVDLTSQSNQTGYDENDRPSSPDPNWEDEYDDLSSSGKEQSPPLRKKRRSSPALILLSAPSSPSLTNTIVREPKVNRVNIMSSSLGLLKKIPGKKKANLKRNSLHNWVYNQRRLQYEGNLPIHRKKLLDKIGFDWKWVQQKIDEEKALNGNESSDMASEPAAASNDEEVVLSEAIPNSKSEELWMTRYKELIEFRERHGHYEVPRYVE